MSTRCQIVIADAGLVIRRHGDGYPDGEHGVLAALIPLVARFKKYRGWDPNSLAAHVVHRMVEAYHATLRAHNRLDLSTEFISFGVSRLDEGLYGDLDYVYVVHADLIEVRRPTADPSLGNFGLADTRLLRRVALDGTKPRLAKKRRAELAAFAAGPPAPAAAPPPPVYTRSLELT